MSPSNSEDPSIPRRYAPSNSLVVYPDDETANIATLDTLRVYCEHTIDDERRTSIHRRLFEVVPTLDAGSSPRNAPHDGDGHGDGEGVTDTVTFVYDGPLELTSNHGELTRGPKEGGTPTHVLECEGTSPEIELLRSRFWDALNEPTVYEIDGIDDQTFEVRAYCPDRYALSFDFPPMRSISGGVKLTGRIDEADPVARRDREMEIDVTNATWAPTRQELTTVDQKTGVDDRRGSTETTTETQDAAVQAIRLRRNHRGVEANVLELASGALTLAAQIQELIALVQDNAPKLGWYFEAETQVMQGTLHFEWGWREYAKPGQEHRAFYWMCLNADIALLTANVEIGIGVEGFKFELQVFGRIEGSVTLNAALQRVSPDGDAGIRADLKGEIIGSLGARFKVPYLVKATGSVKTKLILEGEFRARQDDGLRMTLDTYWTGITALITWSAGVETEAVGFQQDQESQPVEVISAPPRQKGLLLGQWTWPDESRYEPERIPRSEVESVFREVFTAGHVLLGGEWDVRVREHGRKDRRVRHLARPDTWEPDYRWWNEQDVVAAVVDRVEARPHLMMRRTSVEALAMEIRDRLQSMMDEHRAEYADDVPFDKHQETLDWKHERKTPHLRAADFESFLDSDAFQSILDGYVDPIQEQIGEMTTDSA